MNHSLKGFLVSAIVHLFVIISFIYAYDNVKMNKEEKIKKVVIDLNMIEEITKLKQVTAKKEIEKSQKIVKKQVMSQNVSKKTAQKSNKIKSNPPKAKTLINNTMPKSELSKEIVKKERKEETQKITQADTQSKKILEELAHKKESTKNEIKKIQSDRSYTQQYMKNNLAYIIRAIKKYKKYPFNAKKMGFEGKCIVSCVYTKSGVVKDIKVKKSSGYEILDKNSIEILKLASREFKAPSQNIELHIPFNYYLN